MGQLSTCMACDGFLPTGADVCPHCDAAVLPAPVASDHGLSFATRRSIWQRAGRTGRLLRGAVMFAGSGAFCLTMMACYGVGPFECGDDLDGDGWDPICGGDCNDDDATINPEALDLTVDGIDQNCDGIDGAVIVDGPDGGDADAGPTCVPEDEDRDFYTTCGDAETPPDCNDSDSRVHPGAVDDSVDGVDQNCDGLDGEGAPADAGSPAVDAGSPAGDAGQPAVDGGAAADAGQPAGDGGAAADAGA
jgi:hypothetical protein